MSHCGFNYVWAMWVACSPPLAHVNLLQEGHFPTDGMGGHAAPAGASSLMKAVPC